MREVDQMQSVISSHRLPCIPELVWTSPHLSVLAFGVWGIVPHIALTHPPGVEWLLIPSKITFTRRKVSISGVNLSVCSILGNLGQGTS